MITKHILQNHFLDALFTQGTKYVHIKFHGINSRVLRICNSIRTHEYRFQFSIERFTNLVGRTDVISRNGSNQKYLGRAFPLNKLCVSNRSKMANTYYRPDSLRSHIFFFLPMPNICRCRAGNGTIDSPPIIESFMSRRGFKTAPSSSLYDLYNNLIIKILCRGGSKIISLSLSFSMNRFLEKFVFNLQAAAYQTFFSPVSCTNPPQCSVI